MFELICDKFDLKLNNWNEVEEELNNILYKFKDINWVVLKDCESKSEVKLVGFKERINVFKKLFNKKKIMDEIILYKVEFIKNYGEKQEKYAKILSSKVTIKKYFKDFFDFKSLSDLKTFKRL